eukprot:7345761-Prymnesium_polylepis.1
MRSRLHDISLPGTPRRPQRRVQRFGPPEGGVDPRRLPWRRRRLARCGAECREAVLALPLVAPRLGAVERVAAADRVKQVNHDRAHLDDASSVGSGRPQLGHDPPMTRVCAALAATGVQLARVIERGREGERARGGRRKERRRDSSRWALQLPQRWAQVAPRGCVEGRGGASGALCRVDDVAQIGALIELVRRAAAAHSRDETGKDLRPPLVGAADGKLGELGRRALERGGEGVVGVETDEKRLVVRRHAGRDDGGARHKHPAAAHIDEARLNLSRRADAAVEPQAEAGVRVREPIEARGRSGARRVVRVVDQLGEAPHRAKVDRRRRTALVGGARAKRDTRRHLQLGRRLVRSRREQHLHSTGRRPPDRLPPHAQ